MPFVTKFKGIFQDEIDVSMRTKYVFFNSQVSTNAYYRIW